MQISGRLVTFDDPPAGISGASVSLNGPAPYQTYTDASGYFSFDNVSGMGSYTLTANATGYHPYMETYELLTQVYDLGDIYMIDTTRPPRDLTANMTDNFSSIFLTWNAPVEVPGSASSEDRARLGYKVWRIAPGTEYNPNGWTLLTPSHIFVRFFTDSLWADLPTGHYRYAVKAVYSGGALSAAVFSPVLLKNGMGLISGRVRRMGNNSPLGGAVVTAGAYSAVTNQHGLFNFILPEGTYYVTCSVGGHQPGEFENVLVLANRVVDLTFDLIEIPQPPSNVQIVRSGYNITVSWVVAPPTLPEPETAPPGLRIVPQALQDSDSGRNPSGYIIWRLLPGEENDPSAWTQVSTSHWSQPSASDNSWKFAPQVTYRWAVKSNYPGGALSTPAFSDPLPYPSERGTVTGVITKWGTYPIQNAEVSCPPHSFITSMDGVYTLELIPGNHVISVSHSSFIGGGANIQLAAGQTLTRNFQLYHIVGMTESFEYYPDFATHFAPWTVLDLDGSPTYAMSSVSWPNAGSPMGFMIFNPTATVPPLNNVSARDGYKMAASFSAINGPNNDWLITLTKQNPQVLKFWARSYTATYGLERFRVGYSTAGPNPATFTYLSQNWTQAPAQWTYYEYPIHIYNDNVWIGIQCVSENAFIFMVDDISLGQIFVSNDDPEENAPPLRLISNLPNPFARETEIHYSLDKAQTVRVDIYNLRGELVKSLLHDTKSEGQHSVTWRGDDFRGR
ncbi:MAG: carboxypeptidase regulatory-like domain-containing protein, partial [Candidatus Cloacimonadaceae bacterium]|nr:carboxypeptidase regulatory-like domain-containing protein [Candidatus Cloacimonadaceae bacterium]